MIQAHHVKGYNSSSLSRFEFRYAILYRQCPTGTLSASPYLPIAGRSHLTNVLIGSGRSCSIPFNDLKLQSKKLKFQLNKRGLCGENGMRKCEDAFETDCSPFLKCFAILALHGSGRIFRNSDTCSGLRLT